MQIQKINVQQNNKQNSVQPQFTGAGDVAVQALRFLDTNQAWGATAVDFSCMVAPRTMTDFTRGADAGIETLRREASGTVNHAAIGLIYGPLASMLLASGINSKYGIKAHKVFADSDAVDVLSKFQYDVVKADKGDRASEFSKKVAESLTTKDGKIMSESARLEFAKTLANDIKNPSKENKAMLKNIVLSDFGEESNIVLKSADKKITASLSDLVDNVTSLSKALFSDKVVESFKHANNFADVNFVKAMKNFGMRRSILGLAIGSGIGCCIQPFNIYLTKKKTGSDGFVGVEGREKDNSLKFKALKAGVATAFGAGVYSFITDHTWKPSKFVKNIQYKGITPTIPQFMLVYGLTIMSRFMVARDKDELREATVKDTLGFLSWLVLGNFVSKGVLKAIDKNAVGKTRDEVLFSALKKAGKSTVENGKALSFKELLAKLPKNDAARKTLRSFNIAQLAGYAFSGIVLGAGIPKLNIYMTKKSEQKHAMNRVMDPQNIMLKPENIAFLSNQMHFTSNKMLSK